MLQATSAESELSLRSALARNNHSLVVMSPAEFIDFAIIQKKQAGVSDQNIIAWIDGIVSNSPQITLDKKKYWAQNKAKIKNFGAYLPVFSDTYALSILAAEMKRGGNILAEYRIKAYSGKPFVILEGYAGLRTQLNGTRYLASNPKVVSMAVGKLGAARAINGGVVISVIFSLGFHALDQLMNDKATWHDFVAGVSVDLVTAATGGAIAWGVVASFVGGAAMVAVGPIAIVVITGAFLATGFNILSDHFELTQRLAKMLRESEARMLKNLHDMKREVRQGLNYADEDPVGFMHKLFGVPYFGVNR